MATGQTMLDLMELCNQELQLQSGEADVVRGLIALNAAQDMFESFVAQQVGLMGDTAATVATVANTETTAFPTTLLRLDALWFIDPTTSRPGWQLSKIDMVGGHARGSWPYYALTAGTGGRPVAYWTDGRLIYWDPLPDAIYTVRWYGFASAAAITASGTFAYPDVCMLPLATFATALMKTGVGDDSSDVISLASSTFGPVVKALGNFNRDRAATLNYRYAHST